MSNTLECDHCGGIAITSDAYGLFTDGDGERCDSCGFPGSVCVEDAPDADDGPVLGEAWWNVGQEANDVCSDMACTECAPYREHDAEDFGERELANIGGGVTND